jgi:hypothetical protein
MPASPVLTSVNGNWSNVVVVWSHYSIPPDSFNLYYKRSADSSWLLHHNQPGEYGLYTGLTPQTAYDFCVTAIEDSVESNPSNVLSFTTLNAPQSR